FADGNAVADRLAFRQDVIEELVVAIDDDRAGRFLAGVLDDVAPIGLGNRGLLVGQVRHQLFVAGIPASLSRRLKRLLHAAAERHCSQSDNYECNRTHCHNRLLPRPYCAAPSRESKYLKSLRPCQTLPRCTHKVGDTCCRNAAVALTSGDKWPVSRGVRTPNPATMVPTH